MTETNAFTFLLLPPQTPLTRQWAARLAEAVAGMNLIVAESADEAASAIVSADAAFGTLPATLLAKAQRLRWLQAPQAAPPAGYYYPALISHPLTVTNFREIYNDHISAHILAFVLAFARLLHVFIPQQLRRVWKKPPENLGVVALPGATALKPGLFTSIRTLNRKSRHRLSIMASQPTDRTSSFTASRLPIATRAARHASG